MILCQKKWNDLKLDENVIGETGLWTAFIAGIHTGKGKMT